MGFRWRKRAFEWGDMLINPNKEPVFSDFYAIRNLYKGQEMASDKLDSNPVHPVILSKKPSSFPFTHSK
jgi:hypothetical protein